MGKVKDETPGSRVAKTSAKGGNQAKSSKFRSATNRMLPFFVNLVSIGRYKPTQGWNARLWTAVGFAAVAGVGVLRLFEMANDMRNPAAKYGIPLGVGFVVAWIIYRIVQYPPFADFLIATEAEMNKVSWTTKADLKRATLVVLATVVLMTVFLLGVDTLWSYLLTVFRVIRFDTGDLGQTG